MLSKLDKELRCFCRNIPLLAVYGVDKDGELYVHVKVYKQGRIFGEVVIRGGDSKAKIRCRNCLRWYELRFRPKSVDLKESSAPE